MLCLALLRIPDSTLKITEMVKGILLTSKRFLHEKWTKWEDIIYNYFSSWKNSRGVPL